MIITPTNGNVLSSNYTFSPLPVFNISYEMKAKIFNQEGDIKYEYNPFRNLRGSDGQLKDFRTTELNFNLNSPVDITFQPSYDNSVNLILNDDFNAPKLINSRFTVIEDKRYKVIDRKGNNDTNIYNEGEISQTTRLFKTTERIPYVRFDGLFEGGSLRCGNYVFYFKYCDADGNESDIITESGIISAYVGKINDPFSIRGGIANELSNKTIKFTLNNLDTSYDFLNIYFTRSTSDYTETEITEVCKITSKKVIKDTSMAVTITGLEDIETISIDDLNVQYNIVDKVKTQAQVQNMLFFGNVDKPTIPYKELEDLSLRIYPTVSNDVNIGYLDQNYKPVELSDALRKSEYYDAINVYKYTGFWNKEIYRLGVVYIMKDDTLSPVFNVRGKNAIGAFTRAGNFKTDIANHFTYKPVYAQDGTRNYIDSDYDGFIEDSTIDLENTRGVVRLLYNDDVINKGDNSGVYPLSIDFNIETETLNELDKHVKGFFFVRQKRIPTILAQGITIGVDDVSYLPTLYVEATDNKGVKKRTYITESFMDKSNQLVHDFDSRVLLMDNSNITTGGLLCPEATLRSEYFNEIFTGGLFNISQAPLNVADDFFTQASDNKRHFYVKNYTNVGVSDYIYKDIKLTLIEDNQPLRYSGTRHFSSRAGIPEEAYRYKSFNSEDKNRYAINLVRGAYTGFVGIEGYSEKCSIVDIHIPGYDLANLKDYFLNRAVSFHPYFSMSDRYDLSLLKSNIIYYENAIKSSDNTRFREYRGDCFIGNYTTRIQRNFQDPETPINDSIIEPLTWKNNYKGFDANGSLNKDDISKINRADVNAVRIGHWATFKLCSNINLAYRAIDETNTSELALTGTARAFFPYASMSVTAESKIPESTVVNVGYNSTTSDKIYNILPDVPYIKNIFDNRIMFSEIHVNDAFRNSYRVFQGLDYKDITRQYGAIVKMFEWRGNLMIVFENGVGMLMINERALGAEGGNIFIKGVGVLSDNVMPISTDFGSSWKESIIKTTQWIYGVDTIAKKIWRTNGQQFEIISDFKIQKFLNDNITLDESEKTPMIALRNVKTHYNAFKGDVMFTFYDTTRENKEVIWNFCFNENLNKWITRYSWTPLASASINNVYFSFDRESGKQNSLIGYTLKNSNTSEGIVLSNVNVNQLTRHKVGDLSLKGYDYYAKYDQVFSLDINELDNNLFEIINKQLYYKGQQSFSKFAFNLKVKASLGKLENGSFNEYQSFYDFVSVKVNRSLLSSADKTLYDDSFSTYFWKHGQAGIFDISTPITPANWYGKQHKFEYEFIAVDNPNYHKIFNNLTILSNNAEPESFTFEVVGDTYDIEKVDTVLSNADDTLRTTISKEKVSLRQIAKNLKSFGRLRGNMHYKEDMWDIEIKPFKLGNKEARIRDKYCRIRVTYSGEKLAIITALQTLYTISYS